MADRTSHTQHDVVEQATRWFVRLHSGDCRESDRQQFTEWYAHSAAHQREYQRVAAMWDEMDALKTVPFSELNNLAVGGAQYVPSPQHRSIVRVSVAIAALLLVVCAPVWLWTKPVVYQTAKGERKTIPLSDGSSIVLNTDTALSVQVLPWKRTVALEYGEALFTVIPDAGRPFIVMAGTSEVWVRGTIFNVDKRPDQVVVTVLEGTVQVTTPTGEGTDKEKRESQIIQGQQLAYTETGHVTTITQVETDAIAAWRNGKLVFDAMPLAEVLAEVNRYHTVQLRLANPKLKDLKVSGVFQSEHLDGLLRALTHILPVTARQVSEHVIVLTSGNPKQHAPASQNRSPVFRVKPLP